MKIQWILLLLFLTACADKPKMICSQPYKYDKVTYYSTNISDDEILDNYSNEDSSPNKELMDIVAGISFNKISDSNIITNLERLGFHKMVIENTLFPQLDSTFCVLDIEHEVTTCEPIYRDILVFEKDNHVTGWLKVCFDCGEFEFIGAETGEHDIHWGKVYSILNKMKPTTTNEAEH